jgi:hypothetical protein
MSDIFREVEEEIRRDKAMVFWNKHGTKLVAAALVIVAAVGGWRFYEDYTFKQRAGLGANFEAAIADANEGKAEASAALTTLAEGKDGAYPALAKFRLATEMAAKATDEAGRRDAASAFDAISNDAALPLAWREMAKLRAALVFVDHGPYEEAERRLTPLSAPDQPFRHSAREGIALAAYAAGKFDKALDALQAIILDTEAPASLRQRAEIMLAVVRSGPAAPAK